MTADQTPILTLTRSTTRLIDPEDRVQVIPHLDRRPPTDEEINLLDHWMKKLTEQMDIFEREFAEAQEADDIFTMLTLRHKFGSTSYRIPTFLRNALGEAYDLVDRAEVTSDYESMMAHLRVAQHLIDLIYSWGYGENVNTLTGERILFSNENGGGARVDEVLGLEDSD